MIEYSKATHRMVIFLGAFLLTVGVALFRFDTLTSGILVVVIGAATLILFGPKKSWVS